MNIVFMSEQNFIGKVDSKHSNMRTEYAWINMLDAVHVPYQAYESNHEAHPILESADVLICIPSKSQPAAMQIIHLIRKDFSDKTICVMQEGPVNFWQDWSLNDQSVYLAVLSKITDVVFCHNEKDIEFFLGYTSKPVMVLPTTTVCDNFEQLIIEPKDKVEAAFIGGNMCKWYNGMSSYYSVRDFPLVNITFPSMGRKQDDEEVIMNKIDERIQYLPYTVHSDFMSVLSKHKYAVHLMPTLAAGSFYLNCAVLGIPCIGSKDSDVMQKCFPDLCVDPYDVQGAQELMDMLINDKDFYADVRATALRASKELDVSHQKTAFLNNLTAVTSK